MAMLDAEQRDIDTLAALEVEKETATRFREFLAGNNSRDDQEINEIVTFISLLLRAGFALNKISAMGK